MKKLSQSGIDTKSGSDCSKIAYHWAKKTFVNRKHKPGEIHQRIDGSYATTMDFNGTTLGISSDGIGTKIEIAERTGIYDTLGYDLLAMTIDDLASNGYEPASVSNILDVDTLDARIIDELMKGLYNASKFSSVAVTGGEIAELGNRISGYGNKMHFNWCATGIGALHKRLSSPIDGSKIKDNDVIIAVYNPGFRSNGFSLIRKIMTKKFGEDWHTAPFNDTTTWGEAVLTPCLIYAPLITNLLDNKASIHGLAHITGGGIVDNLGRLLKVQQKGAMLNNLFAPDDCMKEMIRLGKITYEKAFRYWNMGNGYLIVMSEKGAKKYLKLMNSSGIYKARVAGKIVHERMITIDYENHHLVYTDLGNK